jgi:hypothetical protein
MADSVRAPGRVILKHWFGRVLLVLALLAAVAYAADYVVLRYRIATNRSPFATITVHPYDAVPRKDHKIEFLAEDPRDETCVNSLFPHLGDPPCWYLSRHKDQQIDF